MKWLQNGAQPTERVQKVLVAAGILTGEAADKTLAAKKMAKRPVKHKVVKETPVEEATEAPAGEPEAVAEPGQTEEPSQP